MTAPSDSTILLSSIEAAEIAEVTSGYITRLCREGKLEGVRKDGLWYVEKAVLARYLKIIQAEKTARAERLAKERLAEYRMHVPEKSASRSLSFGQMATASFAGVLILGSTVFAGGGLIALLEEDQNALAGISNQQVAAVFSSDPSLSFLERTALYTYETVSEWFWIPVRTLATLILPPGVPQIVYTLGPVTHSTTTVITNNTERIVERGPLYQNRFVTEVIQSGGISDEYLRTQLIALRNAVTADIYEHQRDRNDSNGGNGGSVSFDGNLDGSTITNSTFQGTSVITSTLLADQATTPNLYTSVLGVGSDYITDFTGYGLAVVNGELTVTLAATPFSTSSADSWFSTKSTDTLAEGITNLFFTNARSQLYLDTLSKGYFFSTTSLEYYLAQNAITGFSTTSADYWKEQNNFFSTTSATAFLNTYDKGYFFSTTSANAFLATKTTDNLTEGTGNLYF
ncbi:MAG: helix-turn-helix domain-containing protein, partial [Nitrospirota bacterium]|nr:helix-turn-helix domain-containing protein [Nitrospirota bacterium]